MKQTSLKGLLPNYQIIDPETLVQGDHIAQGGSGQPNPSRGNVISELNVVLYVYVLFSRTKQQLRLKFGPQLVNYMYLHN